MLASLADFQLRKPTGTGTSWEIPPAVWSTGGGGRGGGDYGDVMCVSILQREKPGADAGHNGLLSTVSASW